MKKIIETNGWKLESTEADKKTNVFESLCLADNGCIMHIEDISPKKLIDWGVSQEEFNEALKNVSDYPDLLVELDLMVFRDNDDYPFFKDVSITIYYYDENGTKYLYYTKETK